MADQANVRVLCRFRPLNEKEQGISSQVVGHFPDSRTVVIRSQEKNEPLRFQFDYVFPPDTHQHQIYEIAAKPVVEQVMQGFNGTIFAYGQTSSGKTFTMTGASIDHPELRGIIPRMVETVFTVIDNSESYIEYGVKISYCEIYLEKIKDLLNPVKNNLIVKEDKNRGVYIADLTEQYAANEDDIYELMRIGTGNREVGYTHMNAGSSRSHSIFIITINQNNTQDYSAKTGKLYLVDLAGSEKVGKTGAEGKRLDEAKNINKSLSALGNVIFALTDGKSRHIPYRDSKLTRVLQDSLGGNSKTSLIITCSPSIYNEAETISTLRFGIRAKSIKNKAKINREYTVAELKLLLQKAQESLGQKELLIARMQTLLKNAGIQVTDGDFESPEVKDPDVLEEEVRELTERVQEEEDKNTALREQLEARTHELNQYSDMNSLLQDQCNELQARNQELEDTLANKENIIQDLELTNETIRSELLNSTNSVHNLQKQLKEEQFELEELRSKIRIHMQNEERLGFYQVQAQSLEKQTEEMREEIEAFEARIAVFQQEEEKAKVLRDEYKQLLEKGKEDDDVIKGLRVQLEEFEDRLGAQQRQNVDLMEKVKEYEKSFGELKEELAVHVENEDRLKEFEPLSQQLQAELDKYKGQTLEMQAQIKVYEVNEEKRKDMVEQVEYQAALKKVKKLKKKLKEQPNAPNPNEYETLVKQLEFSNKMQETLMGEIDRIRNILDTRENSERTSGNTELFSEIRQIYDKQMEYIQTMNAANNHIQENISKKSPDQSMMDTASTFPSLPPVPKYDMQTQTDYQDSIRRKLSISQISANNIENAIEADLEFDSNQSQVEQVQMNQDYVEIAGVERNLSVLSKQFIPYAGDNTNGLTIEAQQVQYQVYKPVQILRVGLAITKPSELSLSQQELNQNLSSTQQSLQISPESPTKNLATSSNPPIEIPKSQKTMTFTQLTSITVPTYISTVAIYKPFRAPKTLLVFQAEDQPNFQTPPNHNISDPSSLSIQDRYPTPPTPLNLMTQFQNADQITPPSSNVTPYKLQMSQSGPYYEITPQKPVLTLSNSLEFQHTPIKEVKLTHVTTSESFESAPFPEFENIARAQSLQLEETYKLQMDHQRHKFNRLLNRQNAKIEQLESALDELNHRYALLESTYDVDGVKLREQCSNLQRNLDKLTVTYYQLVQQQNTIQIDKKVYEKKSQLLMTKLQKLEKEHKALKMELSNVKQRADFMENELNSAPRLRGNSRVRMPIRGGLRPVTTVFEEGIPDFASALITGT